jgi:hypothetical protein
VLDAHLATFDERVAKFEPLLKLIDELDAGVEPTVREAEFSVHFPSLDGAGWQTADRTGALVLMDYSEVQALAEIYTLQGFVNDNLQAALSSVTQAASTFAAYEDPYAMPPAARENLRARVAEIRGNLLLDRELCQQLLAAYTTRMSGAPTEGD